MMIINDDKQSSDLLKTMDIKADAKASFASNATSETSLARPHKAEQHRYRLDQEATFSSVNIPQVKSPQVNSRQVNEQSAELAIEAAVAIVINGIHYAVLMASPNQLEYLALGFLYSEGLIEHRHELLDLEVMKLTDEAKLIASKNERLEDTHIPSQAEDFEHLLDYDTYVVDLVLTQRCHWRIQAQKRQLAGRTGCGMCGITGLNQALPNLSGYRAHTSAPTTPKPNLQTLLSIRAQINERQHTHQLTGAVHAASTVIDGQLHLFEDVGRHNALDKLIGWQLRHQIQVDCVVMTSRLSIELVQKAIRMRLPWLIGMSAPTSTAVRVAERYNLGLAGFLRDNRVTYYSQ